MDRFSRSSQSLWISPHQSCLTSSSPCLSLASGGKNNLVIWPIIYIEIKFFKISLTFKMLRWFMFTTFQEISLCCFRFSVLNYFSCVQLYATLWTAARQAPLPMEILSARILKWVAMPSSGYLPDPGILPMPLMSPALAGGFFTTSTTWEDLLYCNNQISKVISLFLLQIF